MRRARHRAGPPARPEPATPSAASSAPDRRRPAPRPASPTCSSSPRPTPAPPCTGPPTSTTSASSVRRDRRRVIGERRFLGLFTSAAYTDERAADPGPRRRKVDAVLAALRLRPDSHSGKDLHEILETLPARRAVPGRRRRALRESIAASCSCRSGAGRGCSCAATTYGRFMSVPGLPAARPLQHRGPPADGGASSREAFGADTVDYTTRVSESVLARLHFVVRVPPGESLPDVDPRRARARSSSTPPAPGTTTSPRRCGHEVGEEEAARLRGPSGGAFPEAYKEDFTPRVAVADLRRDWRRWRTDDGAVEHEPLRAAGPPAASGGSSSTGARRCR